MPCVLNWQSGCLPVKVWFEGCYLTSKDFLTRILLTFLSFSSLGIVPRRIPLKSKYVSLEEGLCGLSYFSIYIGNKLAVGRGGKREETEERERREVEKQAPTICPSNF